MNKLGNFCLLVFLSGSILLFLACNVIEVSELSKGIGIAGFFLLVTSPIGMAVSALTRYSNYRKVTEEREKVFFESLQRELLG